MAVAFGIADDDNVAIVMKKNRTEKQKSRSWTGEKKCANKMTVVCNGDGEKEKMIWNPNLIYVF